MKFFKSLLRNLLVASTIIWAMSSCEEADNRFCSFRARFSYTPVSAVPNLHRACTSLGEYCTITFPPGNKYVVSSPSTRQPDYILRTAIQGYHEFILGLGGGLIIGLPIMPEMLEENSRVVCYDICCPNCYDKFNILKKMSIHTDGTTECNSCNRTYDLNNLGIVAKGEAGRSLYRYYVNYHNATQTISVNNR